MAGAGFRGKLFIVTGASSGLGKALARRLAIHEGADLVVVARRGELLEALASEIGAASASKVTPLVVDLADPDAPARLVQAAFREGDVFGIVNNAGVTKWGATDAFTWEEYEALLRVNALAVMEITLALLPRFRRRGSGAILNVTSEAAFFPLPYQNVYSASKHAAHGFTEALATELRGSGILVTAFAPGGIRTEMMEKSGLSERFPMRSPVLMDPDVVARMAISALKSGRVVSVPGLMNRIQASLLRLIPPGVRRAIIAGVYKPPTEHRTSD